MNYGIPMIMRIQKLHTPNNRSFLQKIDSLLALGASCLNRGSEYIARIRFLDKDNEPEVPGIHARPQAGS